MNIPLSIYIHWPFCKAKCPYCDFNSHVREGVDHARWRAALLSELNRWAEKLPGREVVSIFFGGGTPSLMQASTVAALIDTAFERWRFAENVEITLEANPTSIEAEHFKEFRSAGVNRVSVGIQALVQQDLTFLGRQHTVGEALAALEVARATFPRYTFDLIYSRPGQGMNAWETELRQALALVGNHLSLYQLTIEENTAFHTSCRKGEFVMPQENLAADMYLLTRAIMHSEGLPGYEISNYAKAGEESRHNLAYWRSDDYVGIGPGAHGRYTLYAPCSGLLTSAMEPGSRLPQSADCAITGRFATETIKSPERWLEQVEQTGTGLLPQAPLTLKERSEEAVMMGLRLKGGIDYADYARRTGLALNEVISASAAEKLQRQGLLLSDEAHIELSRDGELLLNRVLAELLTQ